MKDQHYWNQKGKDLIPGETKLFGECFARVFLRDMLRHCLLVDIRNHLVSISRNSCAVPETFQGSWPEITESHLARRIMIAASELEQAELSGRTGAG